MIRIVVGSKTPIKIEATEIAANLEALRASVRGVDCDPRELSQPLGRRTLHGAITRADEAAMEPDWDIAIGIENGLVLERGMFSDLAYVALILPDGSGTFARSEAVPVPVDLAHIVLGGKQRQTIGQLEAARTPGCDHRDPHRIWTNGRTDRKTILVATIREVLKFAIHRMQGEKK